jgi:hypothetical protein
MYVKTERQRLNYIANHQTELRAEIYSTIMDVAISDNAANIRSHDLGRPVILPSSFIGGPRQMRQLYMDAMDIVRRYGKPDLFITFTCNPLWEEIQRELKDCQESSDRPDLVARVFNIKLKALMKDLTCSNIFGKIIAHIHVVEFQKRGLPHAHILLILSAEDKLLIDDFDSVVSAEIPDPTLYPIAHRVVSESMMHGPCGTVNPRSPCMENGICTKGYPKQFYPETIASENGNVEYRRRNDGVSVEKNHVQLDNRWVVPHNLYLCTKYNAHLNVEVNKKMELQMSRLIFFFRSVIQFFQ